MGLCEFLQPTLERPVYGSRSSHPILCWQDGSGSREIIRNSDPYGYTRPIYRIDLPAYFFPRHIIMSDRRRTNRGSVPGSRPAPIRPQSVQVISDDQGADVDEQAITNGSASPGRKGSEMRSSEASLLRTGPSSSHTGSISERYGKDLLIAPADIRWTVQIVKLHRNTAQESSQHVPVIELRELDVSRIRASLASPADIPR
jgi:hypothetical protein